MNVLLLIVGLVATAVGFVTIGFGIPINAFSLGNTLIITGAIAVAAGLLLIAISSVIGQLRRIAGALAARPVASSIARMPEAVSVEPLVPPLSRAASAAEQPGRMPQMAPLPPEAHPVPHADMHPAEFERHELPQELPQALRPKAMPPHIEPHHPEPRVPSAAAAAPPPGPLDWLRAKPKSDPRPQSLPEPRPGRPAPPFAPAYHGDEPPMVEVTDEAPLSPRPPQRQAMPPQPESAPMARAHPPAEPPANKPDFDLVWPDRDTSPQGGERTRRDPVMERPLPSILSRPRERAAGDANVEAPPKPEARSTPEEAPHQPAQEVRPEPKAAAPAAAPRPAPKITPKPPVERGPAILKSGVIDGMPYTLYADGSIEAELPNGTVKFSSVDALRAHLEKQG